MRAGVDSWKVLVCSNILESTMSSRDQLLKPSKNMGLLFNPMVVQGLTFQFLELKPLSQNLYNSSLNSF